MSKYTDQNIDLNNSNLSTTKIVNLVGENKKVLDVGCSSGYLARILKEQFNCKVWGIEVDPKDAEIAKKYCEKVFVADLDRNDWASMLKELKFDVIIFADVLEHLKNPLSVLKILKEHLNKNGYFSISIPNIAHYSVRLELLQGSFAAEETGILDSTHLQYFTYDTLIKMLHEADLKVNLSDFTESPISFDYINNIVEKIADDKTQLNKIVSKFKNYDALAYQYIIKASLKGSENLFEKIEVKKPLLEVNKVIEDRDKHISEVTEVFESNIQDLNNRTTVLQNEIVLKDNHIKNIESIVKKNQGKLEQQRQEISMGKSNIKTLNKQILDKDTHIRNIESELHSINSEVLKIKTSTTWKLLTIYKLFTDILLHPRQKLLKLIRSVKTIGAKATLKNILNRVAPKKSIQTPKINKLEDQYDKWIKAHELTEEILRKKRNELKSFEYLPKISIIMPVYNVEEKWLRKAIESVRGQIYENWELCINDDASTKKHIKPLLQEFEKQDKRIKVKYSKTNQHISGSSNEALSLAIGEFIALMDNDDEIPAHALFEVVKVLNDNKKLDFIYTDEDKLDENENRCDPFFKPDWSPDYFLSTMYTCHLGIYRKSLVDKIGRFRKGYEGSQDYDLVLRVTELTNNIYHIPQILYHWRKIEGSTSAVYSDKGYAKDSAKKALEDALKRREIQGEVVQGKTPESFRIKYKIKDNPLVSIIIPTWNKKDVLQRCIESIEAITDYKNYELLIIDNRSDEPDAIEYLKKLSKKHKVIKYDKPFNFSAINNFAVKKAKGEYVLFLNNDTEIISKEWLSAMLEHSQGEDVGAVGAKLVYPNSQLQHGGVILGIGNNGVDGVAGHANKYIDANQDNFNDLNVYKNRTNQICNYSAVTAACLMTRKEIFKKINGFNEKNLSIAFNDVDLCLRIRQAGYNIVYTPYAALYHHESISRGAEDDPRKQARFAKECNYMLNTWGEVLRNDPFYNPNLTKAHEDYSLDIK